MFKKKKTEPVSADKPGESVRNTGRSGRKGPDPKDWTDKRNYTPELAKQNKKMIPIRVTGTILILLTAGAVVVTSRSAVTALVRNSDNHLSAVAQAIADREASYSVNQTNAHGNTVRIDDEGSADARYVKLYDFTTEQLDWAHENHIRWDEYGNPVDESGKVVDDPTTDVNEIDRAKEAGTIDENGKSKKADTARTPEEIIADQNENENQNENAGANEDNTSASTSENANEKPASDTEKPTEDSTSSDTQDNTSDKSTDTSVYAGNPRITHEADGKWIYHIVWGDTLTKIANETGCDVDTLARLNGIPDPDLIITGHTIILPDPGAEGTPVSASEAVPAADAAGDTAPVTHGESGSGLG